MAEAKKPFADFLVRQRLFPEAGEIFSFAPVSLTTALERGLVVVDTNVLLVPYTTGRASLEQVRRTYARLVADGRLRIPGQVAREFADNRAEKLKTLFQQLSRKREFSAPQSEYPLLEGLPAYSEIVKHETALNETIGAYRKAIAALLETVEKWHWDDPVSLIYRDFFTKEIVIDPTIDRAELLDELKYRQEHRIPPGYRDASNEYSGAGDLLIWKTILELGKQHSKDVVFVSGDEKTDWRYQSENRALYPRFELLDEFRRASEGKSLLIISFAHLLEYFGAPAPVVEEVRQEETAAGLASMSYPSTPARANPKAAQLAVLRWLFGQHPGAEVEAGRPGLPDFVVKVNDQEIGYEVALIRYTPNYMRRVQELGTQVTRFANFPNMPLHIVVVAEESRLVERLRRLAVRSLLAIRGVTQVVIGVLTPDGRFQERYRQELEPPPLDTGA